MVLLLKSFSGLPYLDNVTNWRVFNDDSQIIDFLTNTDIFQDSVIDDEVHKHNLQDYQDEASKIKANCIPRSVLSLEKLFDLQTKFRNTYESKDKQLHYDACSGESRHS
jgi:hypothetical protein